eukprot:TRINITY_DN44702_c0_g1_i1.p1 TRINITY_DN44702_c0_g1~~TRINITY_DN44702_c0_g1_i1.p1  ORF type:complete len:230 (-),score=61.97 TRINITY_DN44702_c0_g1_i1:90-779(-)
MGKHKTKKEKAEKQNSRRQKHGAADKEVDPEVAAQVREIEERLVTLSLEMKKVERKMQVCGVEAHRSNLTRQDLQDVPDDGKVYRQVGKMFMVSKKADISKSLQAMVAVKTVEKQQLKQAYNNLELKAKGEGVALRELIGVERMKQLLERPERPSTSMGLPGLDAIPEEGSSNADELRPIWGSASRTDTAGGASDTTNPGQPKGEAAVETESLAGGGGTGGSVEGGDGS